MIKFFKNQKGSTLFFAVGVALTFCLVAGAMLSTSNSQIKRSGSSRIQSVVEENARSAANLVFLRLKEETKKIPGAQLSTQTLNQIAQSIDIADTGCEYDVQFHNPNQSETSFKVPTNKYFPKEFFDFLTHKKIYHFTAKAKCGDIVKVANSYVSIYAVSMFNWFQISDFPLSWAPGSSFTIQGRIHSNAGFHVGGYGGVHFSPSDPSNPLHIAASTSGDMWSMFRIANIESGWSYPYYDAGYIRTTPDEEIKFCTTRGASAPDCYLANDVPTDLSVCGDRNDPDCWVYTDAVTNYTHYNVKVNVDHEDFKERVATHTDEIKPTWATALVDPDTGQPDPHRLIEPKADNDTQADLNYKRWYAAEIRIMDGKSVDVDGDEILTGPFSTSNLSSLGIFSKEDRKWYMPQDGRNADVTFFHANNFLNVKNNAATYPDFAGVKNIYIGSYNPPSGEAHFPSPDCNCARDNGGFWQPICMDDDGTNCTAGSCVVGDEALCDPSTTGSMHAVMVTGAQQAPEGGYQLTTNNTLMLQGDTNTINTQPVVFASDTEFYASNYWLTQSGAEGQGWDADNPTGPRSGTTTTYKHASITGHARTLAENWSGNVNRYISMVNMYLPKDFPPPVGDSRINNWHKLAWRMFYSGGTWRNYFFEQSESISSEDIAVFIGKTHTTMIDEDQIDVMAQNGVAWADSIPDSDIVKYGEDTEPEPEPDPEIEPEPDPDPTPYVPPDFGDDDDNPESDPSTNPKDEETSESSSTQY